MLSFIKNIFKDNEMSGLNREDLAWLQGVIADKMASQQQLGLKELNEIPKQILKKLDRAVTRENTFNDVVIMSELSQTLSFDNVVFMRDNVEVGKITVGKV